PSRFVTVTFTAPAAWAGVVAVIVVALRTVTLVAAVPPTLTVAPVAKPVPVIVSAVPPVVEPVAGDTWVIVGAGATWVNAVVAVALWPSRLVTVTFTAPAAWAGVVAVIVVLLTTLTLVAAVPPTLTVAPVAKPVPVIVSAVPPVVEPVAGDTLVIVGAGAT